jgi:hypothetical protein
VKPVSSTLKWHFLLPVALAWLGPVTVSRGEFHGPRTVEHEGARYVELSTLEAFGFQFSTLEVGARTVDVQVAGAKWQFQNGGDRIALSGGKPVPMNHPLLVLDGRLYLQEKDAWDHFQVRLDAHRISFRGKTSDIEPQKLVSDYCTHKVERLDRRNSVIVLKKGVRGLASLHKGNTPVTLDAGQVLLVRRSCRLDGVDYLVATNTGPNPESYLVQAGDLADAQQEA